MKWYSVKKYKPPAHCTRCLVRTEGGGLYIAENVEMECGYEWEGSTSEVYIAGVTHFCIPEPVEIEE